MPHADTRITINQNTIKQKMISVIVLRYSQRIYFFCNIYCFE